MCVRNAGSYFRVFRDMIFPMNRRNQWATDECDVDLWHWNFFLSRDKSENQTIRCYSLPFIWIVSIITLQTNLSTTMATDQIIRAIQISAIKSIFFRWIKNVTKICIWNEPLKISPSKSSISPLKSIWVIRTPIKIFYNLKNWINSH